MALFSSELLTRSRTVDADSTRGDYRRRPKKGPEIRLESGDED